MAGAESTAGPARALLHVRSERPFDLGSAVASASASSGLPAPIIAALLARADPTITDRVRRSKHAGVIETNLAGMPGISVSGAPGATRVAWSPVGVANEQVVEIMSPSGGLTVRDTMLLTHLSTRYVRLGCPPDRTVGFSLNDLANTLGYAKAGGRTLELVEASLHRLMSVTIRMQLRVGRVVGMAEWHLLDRMFKVSRGSRGMGGVRLSEDYASLINGGNVTFLDMRLVGAIAHQPCYGAIATRLYLMLEAQQGPGLRPWNFPVFLSEPGGPPRTYSPLVELLGLTDRKRYRIRAKIEGAMRVIEAVDPRYVGRLVAAREEGQFNLVVRRGPTDPGGARPRTPRVRTSDSRGRPPDRQPPATSSLNVEDERRGHQVYGAGTGSPTVPRDSAHELAATSGDASATTPPAERADSAPGTAGESEFRQKVLPGLSPTLQADWGLLD